MSFISQIATQLKTEKDFYDLSQNIEFRDFDVIGFRDSTLFLEFAAFVKADRLTEMHIVTLRDKFFDLTRNLPEGFNLKPKIKNPNGLLAFVFEDGCSEKKADFIQKQSKIAHDVKGGVIVSWAIDAKSKSIYTNYKMVSWFPPVCILPETVYPRLKYLQSVLNSN